MFRARLYSDNTFEVTEVDDSEGEGWGKNVIYTFSTRGQKSSHCVYRKTKKAAIMAMRGFINGLIQKHKDSIRELKEVLDSIKEG